MLLILYRWSKLIDIFTWFMNIVRVEHYKTWLEIKEIYLKDKLWEYSNKL